MSNRTLAIIGFVIFNVVFFVAMDNVRSRIPFSCSNSCPDTRGAEPSNARLEVYLFMVMSELAHANELRAEELIKLHPDLKAEIRYKQFEHGIAEISSSRGMLKFPPLRESFKADYEALSERYLAENPDKKIPSE